MNDSTAAAAGSAPARRTWRVWTVRDTRVALVAAGVLMTGVGVLVAIGDIAPRQYPAILGWLVAALLVHDVLIAGVVFAVSLAGRRIERKVPSTVVLIVQAALAVGAIAALLVVPEIVKKAAGTANPSVLPLDYGLTLTVYLIVVAAAAGFAILLHTVLTRRLRRSIDTR